MREEKLSGDSFNVNIGDVSSGQVAIGRNITQVQTRQALNRTESQELKRLFEELQSEVEQKAPVTEKAQALEQVSELRDAITAKEPDPTRMERVRNWFVQHLPAVAGSVTGLIVNPLVGKLVEAGGDALASNFRRRFGIENPRGR